MFTFYQFNFISDKYYFYKLLISIEISIEDGNVYNVNRGQTIKGLYKTKIKTSSIVAVN